MDRSVEAPAARGGPRHDREIALTLMRAALEVLDRDGERSGAALLQHAVDVLSGASPGTPDDDDIARLLPP